MRILIISENRAIASGISISDFLILDSDLSEKSAYEIARSLRIKHCRMPIILLVQKCEVEDRIKGMKSGVDYFLLQPYDVRELLASVDALLQRITDQAEEPYYGNTRLILASGKLVSGDQSIRLSAKEFEVMRLLLQAKDRLLSKEVILARVWGYDSNAVENHVEVYVGFLRKKLRSIGSNLEIKAVRRMGYTLEIREET